MSSGERDSLNLGFPLPPYYASVYCNISAKAGQNLMNFVKMDGVDLGQFYYKIFMLRLN